MNGDDDYAHYFQERWRREESFINCEHDTIFHKDSIEQLVYCPEPWCAFAVDGNDVTIGGKDPVLTTLKPFNEGGLAPLCLMKFETPFILRFPNLWDEAWLYDDLPSWHHLDAYLYEYTKERSAVCHQHYPNVINANKMYRQKIQNLREDL